MRNSCELFMYYSVPENCTGSWNRFRHNWRLAGRPSVRTERVLNAKVRPWMSWAKKRRRPRADCARTLKIVLSSISLEHATLLSHRQVDIKSITTSNWTPISPQEFSNQLAQVMNFGHEFLRADKPFIYIYEKQAWKTDLIHWTR